MGSVDDEVKLREKQRDYDQLDDEDYEMLEENLGVKVKRVSFT
jgi:hypothetical protein